MSEKNKKYGRKDPADDLIRVGFMDKYGTRGLTKKIPRRRMTKDILVGFILYKLSIHFLYIYTYNSNYTYIPICLG